jgi:hypothetical protein
VVVGRSVYDPISGSYSLYDRLGLVEGRCPIGWTYDIRYLDTVSDEL